MNATTQKRYFGRLCAYVQKRFDRVRVPSTGNWGEYRRLRTDRLVPAYAAVLEHMMHDAGVVPGRDGSLRACIERTVGGLRVLDVGGRLGEFAGFLADHGAHTAFSTQNSFHRYADERRRFPGEDVRSELTQFLGMGKALSDFTPHVVISINHFSKKRGVRSSVLLRELQKLAGPATVFYVAPSVVEHGSLLDAMVLAQAGGKRWGDVHEMTAHVGGRQRNTVYRTIRFKLKA